MNCKIIKYQIGLLVIIFSATFTSAQNADIITEIKNARKIELKSLDLAIDFINSHASNEQEKALGVYYLIATKIRYDSKKALKDKPSFTKPSEVYNKERAVCLGYALLFEYMCVKMHLNCHVVYGYSKGYGYKNGQTLVAADHAWNTVMIDSSWYLIDVTWARGTVHKKLFRFNYSEDYFCMNPKLFITKHLPEIPMWQLLNYPVPIKIFSSGEKKISEYLHQENINVYYDYKDTIAAFYKKDSLVQTNLYGNTAMLFNPLNKTPLAFDILTSIYYKVQKDSSYLMDNQSNSIDSMMLRTTLAIDFLKKSKANQKVLNETIKKIILLGYGTQSMLWYLKAMSIKKNVEFSSISVFDSLVLITKPFLKAYEYSKKYSVEAEDNRRLKVLEHNLCFYYMKIFDLYQSFERSENDKARRKNIEKEKYLLVQSFRKNIPSYSFRYKLLEIYFSSDR